MLSLEKRFERALKNLSVKSEVVENLPALAFYFDGADRTDLLPDYEEVTPFHIALHALQYDGVEENAEVGLSDIICSDSATLVDLGNHLKEILLGIDESWKCIGLDFQDGMVYVEFMHTSGEWGLTYLNDAVVSCTLSFEQSIEKAYVLVREDIGDNAQRHTVYLLAGDKITKSWQNATNKPLEWVLREYE